MKNEQATSQVRDSVVISEVGPRDGLQSIAALMPTNEKVRWIKAMYDAGVAEIEVGSFVPARSLPQMADTDVVVQHALELPGLTVVVLVPNLQGARAAIQSKAHKITVPVSVSRAHSQANVRKTPEEMIRAVRDIVHLRDAESPTTKIEVGLSTAFGCTLQGAVSEDDVLKLAVAAVEAGVDECGLSDTAGYANPAQVKRLFKRLKQEIGSHAGAAHLHNTLGLGLANCLAAYEAGVRTFDASLGGLGGCPYAPGATGNVVTEDLAFMFQAMGVHTGIDLPKLLAARSVIEAALPDEPLYGMLAQAGIPKNFTAPTHD